MLLSEKDIDKIKNSCDKFNLFMHRKNLKKLGQKYTDFVNKQTCEENLNINEEQEKNDS